LISEKSFIIAFIFINVAMFIITLLMRKTNYLIKASTIALVFLALLSVLRLIVPLDLPFAYIVNSYRIIPSIKTILWNDLGGESMYDGRLGFALPLLWITYFVFLFCATVHKFYIYRKNRINYEIIDSVQVNRVLERLQLKKLNVYVSPNVGIPYVTGLRNAYVYLPDMELSDDMLEMIIMHEYQHFKSRDILIKSIYLLLRIVFWWNPFMYLFQRELDKLLEIRCDTNVTKHMSEKERVHYLDTMLSFAKLINTDEPKKLLVAPAFFHSDKYGFMEQRLSVVANNGKNKSRLLQFISIVLVMFLFFGSYSFVLQPAYNPPKRDLSDAFAINTDFDIQLPDNSILANIEHRNITEWYCRFKDGILEMRLWSVSQGKWLTRWMLAPV